MRRALLIAVSACLLAPASAAAAPYAPAPGKVFHSGIGGYGPDAVDAFATQSGTRPAVYQYFVSWKSARPDQGFMERMLRQTAASGARTMFAVSTKGTGLTPGAIARGGGDGFLLAMNRMLAEHGRPAYLRLLSEMNNGANPYSAYDLSGRSRGRAFSVRAFRQAWRRAVLVIRGGDVVGLNGKLVRMGMPPVRGDAVALPQPAVAFLWVPLSFGNPEIARNHPRRWWPGSRYVDWVGTTWYSRHLAVKAMDRFYRYRLWRNKPFAFGEYGVWGAESPRFLWLFFRFVRSHPRVQLISYYQSALLKPEFRLSTHPVSRGVLRRAVRSGRFVGGG